MRVCLGVEGRGTYGGFFFKCKVSFEGGENILKLMVVELYLKKKFSF